MCGRERACLCVRAVFHYCAESSAVAPGVNACATVLGGVSITCCSGHRFSSPRALDPGSGGVWIGLETLANTLDQML